MSSFDLPKTMRCVEISELGGPEVLRATMRPCPHPKTGEILIKVTAAGVNRPDILQRHGKHPIPTGASDLPGLEVSGIIAALGDTSSRWSIGDAVCALLPGGGYAEYAIADAGQCMTIPPSISLQDAAGLPETIMTVWANAFEDGELKAGETLLVHGGTSGIGMSAIAMATARDVNVIATAGSREKCEKLKALNLKAVFHYNDDDWESEICSDVIGGVDVVLDITGGDFFPKNINCLNPGGRHASIAFLRGMNAELNIMSMMRKGLKITGSMLRPRPNEEKARLASEVEKEIWPLFASGKIRAMTHATFPLEEARAAHELMESGNHIGKILLLVD